MTDASPVGEGRHEEEAVGFPLSFAQQRLWFLDQLDPGSAAYNVPLALRLRGRLDVAALEEALARLIERHETLRTTFVEDGDEVFQLVRPLDRRYRLGVVDAGGGSDEEVIERVLQEVDRPFNLATGPLLRSLLIRIADEDHALVLTLHHIISDAWSLRVLRRDLAELYAALTAGAAPKLPELAVQYADFAVWQREWFADDRLERALDYWRTELHDAPAVLDLPLDRPRPPVQSDRGAHCRATIASGLVDELVALGRDEGATMFMTLLAAFAILLARYTGQPDFVVGTPIANRNRVELEPLIGFFANTLALRMDARADLSFRDLLRKTRDTALHAYANQDLPFEKLVAELNPERDLSHSPLFQVLFQFHETMSTDHELSGLTSSRIELDRKRTKFDLSLTLARRDDGLSASLEYSTDLFDASTIERLLADFETVLRAIVADPACPLGDLAILSALEQAQLRRWNDTSWSVPEREIQVHEIFEERVEQSPNAIALKMGSRALTYAGLNAEANQLGRKLRGAGVGPDVPVAIYLDRSPELALSVLAALKAGGAYTPLDTSYPAERLRFMLEEAAAPVLITQARLLAGLPEYRGEIICLDEQAKPDDAGAENLPRLGGAKNLAYILFTSGSTGQPKGVAMPHATLSNLLMWQRSHFASCAPARTLQFASMSFDVAFQELFSTWIDGGTLIMVDEETRRDPEALLTILSEERVERLFLPYVALQQLAETALELGHLPHSLREIVTAGEALQVTSAIREFFTLLPACSLHNEYGPTESHVVTSFALEGAARTWPDRPSIGRPIWNARIHILDKRGHPTPIGVPGDLHIGGAVLARGYLGRPELTEERFVDDRFEAGGGRLYRTGDRARFLPDGNLEFLGRFDDQVKIRGYRIEPGEIEAQLASHDAVRDAVVVAREDTDDRRLVAYVVADEGPTDGLEAELQRHLRAVLPEYMVPAAVVRLDHFPLSPNGKIDRLRLPTPTGHARADELVEPRTPTEQLIAQIWSDVLEIEQVGINDDFFDLGGHSLLATRVISRIRRAFEIDIALRSIFAEPTVGGLARVVEDLQATEEPAAGMVLRPIDRALHRVASNGPPDSATA